MSRTSTIDNIINSRRTKAADINARFDIINKLHYYLPQLSETTRELQAKNQDKPDVIKSLERVHRSIDKSAGIVKQLKHKLTILKNRTGRDTINIGMVGLAKQGKSTFLKTLTGLEEAIIPTGEAYVTGACSYLCHDEAVPAGEEYAMITTFSHEEFLNEVLKPFCDAFNLHLNSVEELPYLTLPEESELLQTQKVILERLKGLKEHYNSYKSLLGTPPCRKPKHEIRRYVAKHAEDGVTEYFDWYAVKKAEIHCRFPQNDIGRIMICDTPGQKDFTPGAEDALMKKLSEDMDIVFFMIKRDPVSAEVQEEHTQFHDMVKKAAPLFEVNDWTYMLLNCIGGSAPSKILLDNLQSKVPTRMAPQPLDASKEDDVKTTFETILKDIVGQIPILDAKLLDDLKEQTLALKQALDELCSATNKTFKAASDNRRLDDKAAKLIEQLYSELDKYKEKITTQSLAPAIAEIIQGMDDNVPELTYNAIDAKNVGMWSGDMKNKLRAEFVKRFSQLDIVMNDMVEKALSELENILTSDDGGRLGFIREQAPNGNFWEALKATIEETLDEYEYLNMAIDNICTTKLHFRAFILPRLTEITTGLSGGPEAGADYARFAVQHGEDIETCRNSLLSAWEYITGRCEELFDDCDGELKDINYTPAKAIKAMVEEFILLWYSHNGRTQAEKNLCDFYIQHADEIWPASKAPSSDQHLKQRWNAILRDIKEQTTQLN